ncbi:hypothetical protein [Lacticaseibacillus nasuensis]|uniref:hypothetical protein n=1 Tax=Lacticaseibacillus nasuensis TaxID=944671 RepID=UPI0006D1C272|nr:hypothetical protein [Lacticaseibacillus nasuensis]
MKKLLLAISTVFLLAGCGPVFNQKQTLTTHTTAVRTAVTKEKKALSAIDAAFNAFPSTFQTAYQDDPKADFAQDQALTQLTEDAKTAFAKFEAAHDALDSSQTALNKLANQHASNLPTTSLQSLATSLRLTKLDNRTYATYYKELSEAVNQFYRDVATDPSAKPRMLP